MTAPFSALVERFFTDRLVRQRQASPHTIAAYRDTFRLVLHFAADRLRRSPAALTMEDVSPALITDFLEHLGRDRHNASRTRNARLAAIHAFAQFVALEEPAYALLCQRLLAESASSSSGTGNWSHTRATTSAGCARRWACTDTRASWAQWTTVALRGGVR